MKNVSKILIITACCIGTLYIQTWLYFKTAPLRYNSERWIAAHLPGMTVPPPLSQADKAAAPHTKYTDDIESFVTYDVASKDRPAALLGAQRAVTWMESHGVIDYFPPSEGDSP